MKRSILALFAFVGFLAVGSLQASLKYPAEIGAHVGYLWVEGDTDVKSAPLFGGRFGTYLSDDVAAELSVLGGKSDLRGSDKSADLLLPTLEFQKYLGEGTWRPYIAGGAGYLQINRDRSLRKNNIDFAVLYGAGVKWQFYRSLVARIDGRHVIDIESGRGTHSGLVTLGLSWIYGNEDVEKKTKAKPAPVKTVDSDNDGVNDDKDSCPGTPAGKRVNIAGCPIDSDEDGVLDENDQCPDTPAGMTVDSKGCPMVADSDQDGVPDDKDECAGTPYGVAVDAVGCPKGATAVPEKEWVLRGVRFETNSDKLTSDSIQSLEEAVSILQTHSRIRVEIQGHTDRTGSAEINQKLSEARAVAVKTYLVGRGVAGDRLETKGFGFSKPTADNRTPQGRAKNRRIEFRVLSR